MKKTIGFLIVAGLATQMAVGDVFEDLATYHYGDDPVVGDQAEQLLQDTPVDRHAEIEDKLIAVIGSGNATASGIQVACRMLQQIGTEKCIPAVSGLLNDEIQSHYARLVLQRMTESSQAGAALRRALETAPDKVKVGIAGSLAERGDTQAITALAKFASSNDRAVARASIAALGKIGGQAAAACLTGLQAPAELKPVLAEALVECAANLPDSDKAGILEAVYGSDHDESQRAAALDGLLSADAQKAVPIITDLIKGDHGLLRSAALRMVVMRPGSPLTAAVVAILPELDAETRALAIGCLGQRGDRSAAKAIRPYLGNADPAVASAAIHALGYLNDSDSIKDLLANAGNQYMRAVESAVAGMLGDDVNRKLVDLIGNQELRVPAIRILAERGYAEAATRLIAMTREGDAASRIAAWDGLADLGTEAEMDALMAALLKVSDDRENKAAVKAIRNVCSKAVNKDQCFDKVASHYPAADNAIKQIVVELAPSAGSGNALNLVRAALKSGNADLYGKAVRALATWPNDSAMDDLLTLAQSANGDVNRILALRGYISRVDVCCRNLPMGKRLEMFKKAEALVKRPDEKRLIASGLRNVQDMDAFRALVAYLDDPDVKADAELAVVELAYDLRRSGDVDELLPVMIKLGDSSQNKTVKEKVGRCLGELYGNRSYIKKWLVAGPYAQQNKGMEDLFKMVFPAEPGATGEVQWKQIRRGIGGESIDLEQALAPGDNCCAYVKTTVTVPTEQTVRLEMGSDDSIKAWVNGTLVHENCLSRGCSPAQDVVKVKLNKGENKIVLKIIDASAQWAFSCRILGETGMPVTGMTASAN